MKNKGLETMLRKTIVAMLLLFTFTTLVSAQDRPLLQDAAAQTAWREDLHVMAERLPKAHPNLFWRMTEADFQKAIDALDADIPYLTEEQIKVGFVRIAAMIDGHSQIGIFQPAIQFHLYGLRLYYFDDGIYVVDAQPLYKEAVGKKLVGIGNLDIDSAYQQVSALAIRDNEYMLKLTTLFMMAVPESLHALGITDDLDHPAYLVEDASGQRTTINPQPLTLDEYLKWGGGYFITLPPNPDVLYLQHQYDELFWFTYLPDSKTLYIQYNAVQRTNASGKTMQKFADEVAAFVEANPIDRTIVDIRHNPGGDNHTYPPLLKLLQQNETLNRPDSLYVIIGRMTLSAAVNFATELEKSVRPIFVGAPTGEPPNLYADARPVILPNSKIQINVSSHFIAKSTPDDTRLAIEPTIATPFSSADYFSGRDPAMEAILNHTTS